MKKNELKRVLKPLIKECIKECIFEEGVLSGLITEVVRGMNNQRIVTENIATHDKQSSSSSYELQKKAEKLEHRRQERIKKLNETLSFGDVDIFEGTKEIPPEASNRSPLSGLPPGDAGVDISDIVSMAGQNWKNLI